jgi:hypothetical protein
MIHQPSHGYNLFSLSFHKRSYWAETANVRFHQSELKGTLMKPIKVAEQALFSCILNQEEIRLINQSLSRRGFHYVLHPRAFHHHHLFRDQPKNKQWGSFLSTSLPLHPTLDILQVPLMSDFFVGAAPFLPTFLCMRRWWKLESGV